MENLVNKVIELNFDEISDYSFPLNEPFGLKVNYNYVNYDLIIKFSKNNKNLICAGPGAHARDEKTSKGILKKPPYFDRHSWHKYFKESYIAYADPIFYEDEKITLGWLVGDKDNWYVEKLSEIILKLTHNQGIKPENILFYGSSGGGIPSITLGTIIKGSKVLVNNVQFNIENYYQFHIENLFNVLRKSFKNLNDEEIKEKIKHRIDLIELFKKEKYIPPINYYVNILSEEDINKNFIPFLQELKNLEFFKDNFNITIYTEEKKVPHEPLHYKKSINIIKIFCKINLYNNEEEEEFLEIKTKNYINKLDKKLKKAKKLNKTMKNSKSWKITKPLRKFKKLIK